MADPNGSFKFYTYNPSLPAAVVFAVLFLASAIFHTYQLVRHRTWYFIPLVIGCLFETVGYVGRLLSAREAPDFTLIPYIMQSLLLLLGPTLFAASIYMVLGRLIRLLEADSYSMIRPNWLTKIFVLGDVLSFLAQSAGGGMLAQAKSNDNVKRGENIIIGGLGIQILFFGFFMIVTLVFHIRISRQPTMKANVLNAPWMHLIYALYLSSLFIMIRSVFRVAEYVMGSDGELKAKEFYIYIFDALLIFIVAVLFNAFHPSRVINRNSSHTRVTSLEVNEEGYLMDNRQPKGQSQHPPDRTGRMR